jgi:hypothetical protein
VEKDITGKIASTDICGALHCDPRRLIGTNLLIPTRYDLNLQLRTKNDVVQAI